MLLGHSAGPFLCLYRFFDLSGLWSLLHVRLPQQLSSVYRGHLREAFGCPSVLASLVVNLV